MDKNQNAMIMPKKLRKVSSSYLNKLKMMNKSLNENYEALLKVVAVDKEEEAIVILREVDAQLQKLKTLLEKERMKESTHPKL
ncbi:unnamed protein product [Nezara viridula]|uniref:Uncharacterized protein n=1 Tax=Nezara viridula TaxID=85310 RepID=A0A9P0MNX3_NEZVI|nr:unnamed protein product [Nezara viridula]